MRSPLRKIRSSILLPDDTEDLIGSYRQLEVEYVELKIKFAQIQSDKDERRLHQSRIDEEIMKERKSIKRIQANYQNIQKRIFQQKNNYEKLNARRHKISQSIRTFKKETLEKIEIEYNHKKEVYDSICKDTQTLRNENESLIEKVKTIKENTINLSADCALIENEGKKASMQRDEFLKNIDDTSLLIRKCKEDIESICSRRNENISHVKEIWSRNEER